MKTTPQPATVPTSSAAETAAPRRLGWSWLWLLVLAAALFAVYWPVLHAPFLWDDDAHLSAHKSIVGPLGFREIWTTAEANYFPLVLTHFWVLHRLFGLEPAVYHVVTIALHVLGAAGLWLVLRKLRVPGAWFGAALWALHPVQVESVAWISEFTNTQSGAFFFFGLWFALRWLAPEDGRAPMTRDYVLALGCALAAALSKPSAVMFPVAAGFLGWWMHRGWRWRNVVWLSPFLLVSLATSGWAIWEQKYHSGALGTDWNQSLWQRVVIAGRVVWFYLGKLLWPEPLTFVYPRWSDQIDALTILPLLGLIAAAVLLWIYRRDALRAPFLVGGLFLAMLFPVLGLFNVYYFRFSFVADHFQYLASAAPLAGAAALTTVALSQSKLRGAIGAVAVALLAAVAVRSRAHVHDFADNDTLWRHTLRGNPTCVLALTNLTVARLDAGNAAEAVRLGEKAVESHPTFGEPYYNLGKAYLATPGQTSRAVDAFKTALSFDPNLQPAYDALANALAQQGRRADAIEWYEKALARDPSDAVAHTNLAVALGGEPARMEEAIRHAAEAVKLSPLSPEAHFNYGLLLARTPAGARRAIDEYREAIRLKPAYFKAHLNLGLALLQSGEPAEAIAEFETALRLDAGSAIAHNNLGVAFAQSNRLEDALTHVREAVRLDPNYADARNNLAYLEAQLSAGRAAR